MRVSGTAFGTVFGLALLFALLAGGYFVFEYVLRVFAALEPPTRTLAAIASVVAVLCAVLVAESLKARAQMEFRSQAAAEKTATYERLLSLCCGQLKGQESDAAPDAERIRVEQSLALYGSAKVISAYVKLLRQLRQGGNADDASSLLRDLVSEMREDLGRTKFAGKQDALLDLLLVRR